MEVRLDTVKELEELTGVDQVAVNHLDDVADVGFLVALDPLEGLGVEVVVVEVEAPGRSDETAAPAPAGELGKMVGGCGDPDRSPEAEAERGKSAEEGFFLRLESQVDRRHRIAPADENRAGGTAEVNARRNARERADLPEKRPEERGVDRFAHEKASRVALGAQLGLMERRSFNVHSSSDPFSVAALFAGVSLSSTCTVSGTL
jgi:hypothetical protein